MAVETEEENVSATEIKQNIKAEQSKSMQEKDERSLKSENEEVCLKLSHKQWRRLLKKERRRLQRQDEAKRRCQEEEFVRTDPVMQAREKAKEKQREYQEFVEEKRREKLNEEWLKREEEAQKEFRRRKAEEERKRYERLEQERRIKEEWESHQKKEKAAKDKKEFDNRQKEGELMKELEKSGIYKDGEPGESDWHNPLAPVDAPSLGSNLFGTEKDRRNCSFFLKTGACRFGERCSRQHPRPTSSVTLLIPAMFLDVRLSEPMLDEKDEDVMLEFDEKELYENFEQFYQDVIPEFQSAGKIVQFKVCCNHEPHLRGNVYIQYETEDEAMKAFTVFNGRWYAGRQLSVQFSPVTNWKSAICGLFDRKKCPRGKNCNFLHVFRNPGNAFRDGFNYRPDAREQRERRRSRELDRRWDNFQRQVNYDANYRRRPGWRPQRSRSRSRSRSRHRSYSRSRSRSRSRSSSRSKSRSLTPDRRGRSNNHKERTYRKRKRHRSKSHRKSRSRSRERSATNDSCQSRHRKSKRRKGKHRDRSRSRSPHDTHYESYVEVELSSDDSYSIEAGRRYLKQAKGKERTPSPLEPTSQRKSNRGTSSERRDDSTNSEWSDLSNL